MTTNTEQLEKMRQAVMRARELLDLMQVYVDRAEFQYTRLFDHIAPDVMEAEHEKSLQGLAAQKLLNDPSALKQIALDMRFHSRTLEREFEALYGNVVGVAVEE